jgi:hypothetical protein
MSITNKAHVEGSIVKAYIIKEMSTFGSHYFNHGHIKGKLRKNRHDVGPETPLDGKPAIFNYPGRAPHKGVQRILGVKEYAAAYLYVLYNCPEIQPFIRYVISSKNYHLKNILIQITLIYY